MGCNQSYKADQYLNSSLLFCSYEAVSVAVLTTFLAVLSHSCFLSVLCNWQVTEGLVQPMELISAQR